MHRMEARDVVNRTKNGPVTRARLDRLGYEKTVDLALIEDAIATLDEIDLRRYRGWDAAKKCIGQDRAKLVTLLDLIADGPKS